MADMWQAYQKWEDSQESGTTLNLAMAFEAGAKWAQEQECGEPCSLCPKCLARALGRE